MSAPKRIALLLAGLGVVGLRAEESIADEQSLSPIFALRAPVDTASPVKKTEPELTPVQRQLASLLRLEIAVVTSPVSRDANSLAPGTVVDDSVKLETMTVQAKRILEPPLRETGLEKFTRTGYLWEFSKSKRFMVGPRGDKVGVMFSFDW